MKFFRSKIESDGLNTIGILLSAVLGATAYFLLYSELLNPMNVDWIIKTGTDPFQHYIGWELYRDSPWSWPLGRIEHIGYPTGIPLTFTDSIPLFSIVFKLFDRWLPFPFQFDGIWMLVTFTLQGVFGYLVSKQYLKKIPLAVLAGVFFIVSPIMLFRLGGHSALGAHWLILWSLFLVLKKDGSARPWHWTVILSLAVLIHPYLFFISGALFFADVIRRIFVSKAISWQKGAAYFFGEMAWVSFLSCAIGVFATGSATASGYGVFSLDLNGLVNPYGWSTIIQNMNVREPNEGFNYLGLGIIFLLVLSAYELWRGGERPNIRAVWREWWPLIAAFLFLTLLAITNTVSAFGREIVHIPLPEFLEEKVLAVVRSSGRLFWPVYYGIFLAAFFVLRKLKTAFAVSLLVFALALQIYDMKDKLIELDTFFSITWENPLKDQFWTSAAESYDHISFVPTYGRGQYEAIAFFAAKHDITLNTGYVVRSAGEVNAGPMRDEIEKLKRKEADSKTLYVFRNVKEAERFGLKNKVKVVDGYVILEP